MTPKKLKPRIALLDGHYVVLLGSQHLARFDCNADDYAYTNARKFIAKFLEEKDHEQIQIEK